MAPYVKRAADLFDARVTMVHVVCDLASTTDSSCACVRRRRSPKSTSKIAQERLRVCLNTEFPGCERVLRCSDAAEEIAEVARSGAFDLIVSSKG
jgi:hypothetical protein